MAKYTNQLLESGSALPEVISVGFDLDLWNNKRRKENQKAKSNSSQSSTDIPNEEGILSEQEKTKVIMLLVSMIQDHIYSFFSKGKLQQLFIEQKDNFFELQNHVRVVLEKRPIEANVEVCSAGFLRLA